jgi:hypothetical protein
VLVYTLNGPKGCELIYTCKCDAAREKYHVCQRPGILDLLPEMLETFCVYYGVDIKGCGCGPNFAGIEQHPEFMTRVTFEDDEDNEFNLREFAQLLQQEAKKYAAP